jgi:hypothetical protein
LHKALASWHVQIHPYWKTDLSDLHQELLKIGKSLSYWFRNPLNMFLKNNSVLKAGSPLPTTFESWQGQILPVLKNFLQIQNVVVPNSVELIKAIQY